MRVCRINPFAFKPCDRTVRPSQHIIGVIFAMTAFDQHCNTCGTCDFDGRALLVGSVFDVCSEEHLGLRHVGSDDSC